ncbi:sigma-70 family RNA polymerase sigma factor [Gramella sp. MAR_2010_147]|uniref:RNA polymerase sigma factor n=1 Tax=Gramella sp. MAR_2010_147 TaxID=1250205 RepID=UPI00087A3AA3|nr:sigma-70 family RNA polymerase sigma factor [Gramella sp. MAR_2010_147]SDS05614.1 RNA polymerase sigma-70 factor, ECF subfamily [Gramella sp. MAR_2010_147]
MSSKTDHIVAHLFRTEYGKLVAILTRIFGAAHIQLAEDIVQDTLISALDDWSKNGVPENPEGWLMLVAKRKVLNELKRNKMKREHHLQKMQNEYSPEEIGTIFFENEIQDSQLRMIFTCCHPDLNTESQISLILKTLCGFGVKEVANALLSNEPAINKRLYRAKNTIRESNLLFEIPEGKELESRLETVLLTLYLLFNEGYNSSVGDDIIKKDLCLEAVRLTKLLSTHFRENRRTSALLALMCFHIARFEARIDDHGGIVLFEDQNRDLWNMEMIEIGMAHLRSSLGDSSLSSYHIEACIAAEHCSANSFESTNWKSIQKLYRLLENFKPNAIIKLNLAIIESKFKGYKASLKMLKDLAEEKELKNYHLLPATQGIFHMKLGNYNEAIKFLEKAQKLNPSAAENSHINSKILECKNSLSS